MPILYVANSSKQSHNFNYRLPEREKLFMQKVDAGAQISIKLETHEIDWVLNQHAKYGMVHIKDVKKETGFSGMVYSIDKVIDAESIENGFKVKDDVITQQSLEHRKIAAASIEDAVSRQAQEMGIEAGNTQVEMEEQKTSPADNEDKFKETIEVSNPSRRGRKRKES